MVGRPTCLERRSVHPKPRWIRGDAVAGRCRSAHLAGGPDSRRPLCLVGQANRRSRPARVRHRRHRLRRHRHRPPGRAWASLGVPRWRTPRLCPLAGVWRVYRASRGTPPTSLLRAATGSATCPRLSGSSTESPASGLDSRLPRRAPGTNRLRLRHPPRTSRPPSRKRARRWFQVAQRGGSTKVARARREPDSRSWQVDAGRRRARRATPAASRTDPVPRRPGYLLAD